MKNPNPDENNKKTVRQVKKNFGQLNGKKTTDDGKQNPIPNSSYTEVTEQKSKTLTIKEDELKSFFDKTFESKQSELRNKQFPKPNPSQIPHPGYNNQNNGPRSPLMCFRCGQTGHMASNCTGRELVVAEIEDEILLGLYILMKGEIGPADIKLSEEVILLNGVTIPCIQIGQPEPVRKVRAADNFTIPPQSEILIDVFVHKTENDPVSPLQDYLIDPVLSLLKIILA
ncbi:unnamed protein product [Mytilus coruscus]|uniref:CCHC-type domain-containing protein n=1 Tax=Mytilus coruscus TaxID=42192 RepID=A0A6J8ELZ9_MYTCO|nr:unnamed protein product [Mytilus coruscus]